MKFAIWRHENSIGNSAEHTYGLYKHLLRNDIKDFEIHVENDFQKCFAMCIPGVKEEDIKFFDEEVRTEKLYAHPSVKDIYFPDVYTDGPSYPAGWGCLGDEPDCRLKFPEHLYENKHNLPENCILMQFREPNTFFKRASGLNEEPQRFVNIDTFFKLAEHYANEGYKVVRMGDTQQAPLPKHENIIDFALVEDRSMMDDLFLISTCKAFLSCDSGVWPMAGAMKKNLVLCNVTSVFDLYLRGDRDASGVNVNPPAYEDVQGNVFCVNEHLIRTDDGKRILPPAKTAIVDWLPEETTKILYKDIEVVPGLIFQNNIPKPLTHINLRDNPYDELKTALESFL